MRLLTTLVLLAAVVSAQESDPPARNFIVLHKQQVIGMGKAFAKFKQRNAEAKRSDLRKEMIEKLKALAKKEQPALLKALGNPKGARSLWIVNAIAVSLDKDQVKKARKLPMVQFVYPAGRMPVAGVGGTVNEVLEGGRREAFTAKGKKIPWNLKQLKAPEVWKQFGKYGDGAVVAMFDAGVNYRQQDLRKNIWINKGEVANNGKDDDGNGLVDDLYGWDFVGMKPELAPPPNGQHHGTWTSSVVAGDGTGGTVTGIAPRARLMLLKGFGGVYNASRVYEYAVEMGADIMSMSFSQPNLGNTRGLWRLMSEHATAAGLVLISGAGNFPNQKIPVQIRIPEGIPCVICVGGVTAKQKFARFTSQGPVEWNRVKFYEDFKMPKGLLKPDVCAFPGPKIALVHPTEEGYMPKNNRKRGNSLSAPHVAGVCALILGAKPELTPWRVKEILEQTAKDIAPRGKDPKTGAGLVDAYKAVKLALGK